MKRYYEALIHVVDPESFIQEVYRRRNSVFRDATVIELAGIVGRCVSAPGDVISIRSEDRLNVEDVLLVDADVEPDELNSFIKLVHFSGEK